ncbi:MAG: ATP-binding protein [bacterium]|nr:ATP-binding protein [bacterium]
MPDVTQSPTIASNPEIQRLRLAHEASTRLNASTDPVIVARELARLAAKACDCPAVVLRLDTENDRLLPVPDRELTGFSDEPILLDDFPNIADWFDGTARLLHAETVTPRSFSALIRAMGVPSAVAVPLTLTGSIPLIGAILLALDNVSQVKPLNGVIEVAAVALRNAIHHARVVEQLSAKTRELDLQRRIDRELNDKMKQDRIFELTVDWAMRVSLAHGATLALYDQNNDALRYALDLGYDVDPAKIDMLRHEVGSGIAHRVARSGHTEVIPDVSVDQDYIELNSAIKSHMSVPVMRDDVVIAVISVESRRLNAFSDDHVDMIEKLATRAGVAIDNTRLYADAVREREKYSLILGAISDLVLAIGPDERVIQINPAAMSALRLYADREYVGEPFGTVLEESPLHEAFKRIKAMGQPAIEEIRLADGHVYHANFTPHPQIGWIIVMHDINEFKQMDQMKSELVATVSHDLRQPLMVMTGYVDLLALNSSVDERGERYLKMLTRSIHTMRRLIEDLLDLAKIERGMQLNIEPVSAAKMIEECMENARPAADVKQMTLTHEIADDMPKIAGDANRLVQIFNNLIMNAIKYTPPEGKVRVWAEQHDNMLRIGVQDNGVGISPPDQARIFEVFYRVRNAENESIEGTGLGLAIVKRLVEAHKGQIGLESRIGQGSTFTVTLPIASAESAAAPVIDLTPTEGQTKSADL